MADPSLAPLAPKPVGYAKGIARREAIVDVATEFFGRVGFRGATMLQIAAACRISRAGLLHHFPTKESLLEAVLERRDEVDHRRTLAVMAASDDGLAALADLVTTAERNATIPAIVNLFAVLSAEAGDPSHPAHDYFVRRYVRSRTSIGRAFELVRERGQLAPGLDPRRLATEIVALMDGLQVQWLLAPDEIDMAVLLRDRLQSALVAPLPG